MDIAAKIKNTTVTNTQSPEEPEGGFSRINDI